MQHQSTLQMGHELTDPTQFPWAEIAGAARAAEGQKCRSRPMSRHRTATEVIDALRPQPIAEIFRALKRVSIDPRRRREYLADGDRADLTRPGPLADVIGFVGSQESGIHSACGSNIRFNAK